TLFQAQLIMLFFSLVQLRPRAPLCPYTTLFRSQRVVPQHLLHVAREEEEHREQRGADEQADDRDDVEAQLGRPGPVAAVDEPREIGRAHVELQSRRDLVCRLLLEKKKKKSNVETKDDKRIVEHDISKTLRQDQQLNTVEDDQSHLKASSYTNRTEAAGNDETHESR